MKPLLLLMTLTCGLAWAVDPPPPNHCSVSAISSGGTNIIGKFDAVIGEEIRTTKIFPIPHTKLKALVSVEYTDESVHIELSPQYTQDTSIIITVLVSENPDENDWDSIAASTGEAAIISDSKQQNLLRVYKIVSKIKNKELAIVAEYRE